MSRRSAGALVAVLVAIAIAGPTLAGIAPAAAQDPGATAYLALDSVSPWVAPDGTWSVRWSVDVEPPLDSVIRYTVHQAVTGPDARRRLDAALDGGDLGPTLQGAEEKPLLALRSGTSARLDVPVRSKAGDADRVLLPNAGIHPVEVQLVSPSAGDLQQMVLFLNRVPTADAPAAMRVAPMLSAVSTPVVGADGAVAVPPPAAAAMESVTDVLRAAGDTTVTLHLDPELLAASAQSVDPADRARLQALLAAARGRPVLRSPWAPIDLESWAASGSLANFQTAVLAGQRVLTDALGSSPVGGVWPVDPSLGQESTEWLDAIGVRRLLVRSSQLAATRDLGDDPGTSQRFKVGSTDSRVDGLAVDGSVTSRLLTGAPELAAHRAITELEATWFAAPAGARTAAVVDLTGVPVAAASAFLADLGSDNPSLRPSTVTQAFDESSAYPESTRKRSGTLVRRISRTEPVRDETAISRELARLRGRAESYHASLDDPEGAAPLDDLLLTVLHRDVDLAGQLGYLAAAGHRIDQGLGFVQPLGSRSFTVTARRSELPLTIVNGGDRDMTVLLRFNGNRLEANGGRPRRVTLRPGPNSISVPVLARTSGDFRMVVEVRTADDAILLTSTAVRIRSTVVSGVGVVLAAGALGFLVLWWGRTIRRDRRARQAQPPEADPTPTDVPPTPVA